MGSLKVIIYHGITGDEGMYKNLVKVKEKLRDRIQVDEKLNILYKGKPKLIISSEDISDSELFSIVEEMIPIMDKDDLEGSIQHVLA